MPASGATSEVARLKGVVGNVLVSREAGLATGAEAQRLLDGTRIITTANSETIVVFDNGCEVHLRPNERLEIDSGKPCAALVPQSLGPPVIATGPPLQMIQVPITVAAMLLTGSGGGGPPTPPISPN